MEDQEDPILGISESVDIKIEEFSDFDDEDGHEQVLNADQGIVQVNIKCEDNNSQQSIPLSRAKTYGRCNIDYEWTCNLCTKAGTNVTKFKQHLSQAHYRGELMALWPRDPSAPCPYCQKCLFSDTSKLVPSQIFRTILSHLGSAHNLILQYLDDTLRSEIETKVTTYSVENVLGEEKVECFLCPTTFKCVRSMKEHLGWNHFREAMLQESGSTNDKCGKCEFEFTGKHDRTKIIIKHLMSRHGFLYKVIPEDMTEKIMRMGKYDLELKEFNISRGIVPEGEYKCPYCTLVMKAYRTMKKHVVQQHLMNDILTMSGCVNTDSCKFCDKKFTTSNKETYQQKLACHLALKHGYLEMTLTEEAQIELDKLKDNLEKNNVVLRKNVKTTKTEPVNSEKRKRKHCKSSQERDEPLPVPENLKERMAVFEDSKTNGELDNEPNDGVKPGREEKVKSFLGCLKPDDWQCFICLQTGNSLHLLKTHLASRHFRKQLQFFWPGNDFDKPCPYCHRQLFKTPSVQDGVKIYFALTHLATQHDLIKHVVTDDVKNALKEFVKVQELLCCPICQEDCKSKASLESHLILEHYRDEVRNASNVSGSLCNICNEQFSNGRTMLLHAARKHGIMEEVFPRKVLDHLGKLEIKTPQGITVKEEISEDIEQDGIQMNFVDLDSVGVNAEPQEKVEPVKDSLEIDIDKLTRKKKKRVQNEDGKLLEQDLSILITDSSIGSLSC